MKAYLFHSASAVTRAAEAVPDRGDASPHTFIGLGLIATAALVVWLVRRSRA